MFQLFEDLAYHSKAVSCGDSAILALFFCVFSLVESRVFAAEDDRSKVNDELVANIWKRLVCDVPVPIAGLEWPPTCTIENQDNVNAFATITAEIVPDSNAKSSDTKSNKGASEKKEPQYKYTPRVVIFRGMLNKVIRTEADKDQEAIADRLAYVLSHELAHLVLLHVLKDPLEQTKLVRTVFDREKEVEADVKGSEFALHAGFSMRRGQESIRRMQKLGMEYSSFEGLLAGHPSWNDRLVHLDSEQAALWKSMSAFENGNFFLMTEQFASAEVCFRQVTREFPKCHEAWTNLGYALLMQYCDGLDTEDLRRFQIGQLLIGGFYQRPTSLEPETRGIQTKVWEEAVACLNQSLKLKEDQVLAKANLGVAFLVHPDGTPHVEKSTRYLREAAANVDRDDALDPLGRAAILINAGVAEMVDKKHDESVRKFALGEKEGFRYFGQSNRVPANTGFVAALVYNRALLLAATTDKVQQQLALPELEKYLTFTSPAGAWWPIAYDKYVELCKTLNIKPKSKDSFVGSTKSTKRLTTSVQLGSGVNLVLSEPLTEAAVRMGERVPVVSRTRLCKFVYQKHGVEVIATDRILGIRLKGDNAPPLQLKNHGLGGEIKELKLKMSEADFKAIVGDAIVDMRPLDDPKVLYQFYPQLGVAARVESGKVSDLAVTQIPRQSGVE